MAHQSTDAPGRPPDVPADDRAAVQRRMGPGSSATVPAQSGREGMSERPSSKQCGHGQGNPRNCPECHPELFPSNQQWIPATKQMPPQNVPVLMRRTGSEQIPKWEWCHVETSTRLTFCPHCGIEAGTAAHPLRPAVKASTLPTCPHGATEEEVCPECLGAPSDNPDDELANCAPAWAGRHLGLPDKKS